MPAWLISREVVVGLAIIGAVVSMLAAALRSRGVLGEAKARLVNRTGYAFMWASISLFIIAGFRS